MTVADLENGLQAVVSGMYAALVAMVVLALIAYTALKIRDKVWRKL
jgi:hypothetical protein